MCIPGLKLRPKVEKLKISNADHIERIVAEYFKISVHKLKTGVDRDITLNRQICIVFQRRYADLTLKKIALRFKKDHTTVMHAINKIQEAIETDTEIRKIMSDIDNIIQKHT